MPKKRILIIDDEASVTRMVKLNLELGGQYEVRTENRARLGITAAREFQPDLILLDVIMPELDGGDVARQIHADPALKATPIVFLTAILSPKEAGPDGMTSGGMRFLSKPVNVDALVLCIEENLPKKTA